MLVDSHCHLNFPELSPVLDEVINSAKIAGVNWMQTICTELAELPTLLEYCERYPNLFCSVGVHPNDSELHPDFSVEQLVEAAQHPKIIGLGETGLDYYYKNSNISVQQTSFSKHIEASQMTGLPLIIHCRDAEEDMVSMLKEAAQQQPLRAVIHCFTGSSKFAEQALDLGCYISFSGIVTFKNAINLQEIAKWVPIDKMLVETDSPFLAPVPFRGKSNQPAYTRQVAEFLSQLRRVELEVIANSTTENFFKLFNKASR